MEITNDLHDAMESGRIREKFLHVGAILDRVYAKNDAETTMMLVNSQPELDTAVQEAEEILTYIKVLRNHGREQAISISQAAHSSATARSLKLFRAKVFLYSALFVRDIYVMHVYRPCS